MEAPGWGDDDFEDWDDEVDDIDDDFEDWGDEVDDDVEDEEMDDREGGEVSHASSKKRPRVTPPGAMNDDDELDIALKDRRDKWQRAGFAFLMRFNENSEGTELDDSPLQSLLVEDDDMSLHLTMKLVGAFFQRNPWPGLYLGIAETSLTANRLITLMGKISDSVRSEFYARLNQDKATGDMTKEEQYHLFGDYLRRQRHGVVYGSESRTMLPLLGNEHAGDDPRSETAPQGFSRILYDLADSHDAKVREASRDVMRLMVSIIQKEAIQNLVCTEMQLQFALGGEQDLTSAHGDRASMAKRIIVTFVRGKQGSKPVTFYVAKDSITGRMILNKKMTKSVKLGTINCHDKAIYGGDHFLFGKEQIHDGFRIYHQVGAAQVDVATIIFTFQKAREVGCHLGTAKEQYDNFAAFVKQKCGPL